MTGCGCLLVFAALIGLLAVFIFGSTDPGEPIASSVALAALVLSWAAVRATSSRARTPARP